MSTSESVCPGCGLKMPRRENALYDGGYNTSPECWDVFTEVIGKEFGNALLFGQVHQLTVDTYAAQHAGSGQRDKSVVIHLCGLHLVLERGLRPTTIPALFQKLANSAEVWPHFEPPTEMPLMTVFDVALAESDQEHIKLVREWASFVWGKWSAHHQQIRSFVAEHF